MKLGRLMRALLRQIELEAAVAAALQTHIEPQLANYTHAIGWHQREQADREPFAQRLRLLGMRVRRERLVLLLCRDASALRLLPRNPVRMPLGVQSLVLRLRLRLGSQSKDLV
eukprot:7153367-Prymnesium_polylepis.1